MKCTTILVCCIALLAACKKEAGAGTGSSKLTGVFTDTSQQTWIFTYTGGKITRTSQAGAGSPNTFIDFKYKGSSYINAIPVNLSNSLSWGIDSIEYFLTDLKLPLRIVTHFPGGAGNIETDFFYKPGTNLLDSANNIVSPNMYADTRRAHYTFGYQGGDITSVNLTLFGPGTETFTYTAWFTYTYDANTPNIFRNTDSLLYIYQYPFPYWMGSYNETLFFFPEVFSTSTFITADVGYVNLPVSSLNLPFTLTDDKKVKTALFYTYFYQ